MWAKHMILWHVQNHITATGGNNDPGQVIAERNSGSGSIWAFAGITGSTPQERNVQRRLNQVPLNSGFGLNGSEPPSPAIIALQWLSGRWERGYRE